MKNPLTFPLLATAAIAALLMTGCSAPSGPAQEPDPVLDQSGGEAAPEESEAEPALPEFSPDSVLDGTGSLIDSAGYTVSVEAAFALSAWEVSVADSLPGQAKATSTLSGSLTITNTTSARETTFRGLLWLIVAYPNGSAACGAGTGKVVTAWNAPTTTKDEKYCIHVLADFQKAMLAPGERRNLEVSPVSDRPPSMKIVGQEDQMDSLISVMASPSFMYLAATPGSGDTWQAQGNPALCTLGVSRGTRAFSPLSVVIASPGFVCSP